MEDGDTELNITQPVLYFATSERRHSRWRSGARCHALRPFHEAGAMDEDTEPARTPPVVDVVKLVP